MSESIFNLIDQSSSRPSLLPKHVATYEPTATQGPAPGLKRVSSLRGGVTQPTKSAVGTTSRVPRPTDATGAAALKAPSMAVYDMARAAAQEPKDLPRIRTKPGIPSAARPGKKEEDAAVVARRRQQAQMRGTAMAMALAPEIRRDVRRVPKNHVNDNVEKLKEQSIVNGLIKEQGDWARPAGRKPEFTGRPKQAAPDAVDFVEENRRAILENAEKSKRAAAPKGQKYQQTQRPAGQIPKYLIERKIEMEVDQAMREDEERRKRSGPAVMPEEERLATLKELETQKSAALKELNMIPPSKVELAAYKAQVKKLETRLAEIENAILLFSRKVVYVQ